MELLRVEFRGKALDARRLHANAFRTAEFLAYREILEIAHGRATIRHGAATLKTARHEKTQHRLQRLEAGAAPPGATVAARGQACPATTETLCIAASARSRRHRSSRPCGGLALALTAARPHRRRGGSDRAPRDRRGAAEAECDRCLRENPAFRGRRA